MKLPQILLLAVVVTAAINCTSTARSPAENTNANTAANNSVASTATPLPATEGAAQTSIAPDALVKDLYKTHDKENGAIVQGKNRAILDKYFDKNLGGLIWKDMTTNQNEVGVIDFDIFYNSQDPEIKKFAVGEAKIDGEKATVPVTFENGGKKETLTYSLVKEKAAWKISDINYGGDSLLKYFKDAATAEKTNNTVSSTGEFEGKYQIGDTTCTVKPVKMAFEVRWEKGSGVEMFFSEGRANDREIFASDPKTGKANSFAFDDENYNSGTFYRADGKEFPIARIK